ncbi:UNVERIFIED_CONTAM: Cell wall-associated hydrolases (invasion-associated proteins) [Acetivibrio alkalicellulosi]
MKGIIESLSNSKRYKTGKVIHGILFLVLFFVLAVLLYNPINRSITNLMIFANIISILLYSSFLFYKFKIYKGFLVLLFITVLWLLFIDGKTIDKEVIRNEYIESLKRYEGTVYLWGGESIFGIDCSGLVRRGVIDAYFKLGVRNLSPKYIRKALYLWVFDFSAEAMKEEYRGLTVPIISIENLNGFDHSMLKEGDIMVTQNGIHTMAYIGNNEWIQADPAHRKVIIEKVPSENNNWYKEPAVILRWAYLE